MFSARTYSVHRQCHYKLMLFDLKLLASNLDKFKIPGYSLLTYTECSVTVAGLGKTPLRRQHPDG
jgi:hypothetical protein